MKYFSAAQIREAMVRLRPHHSFFACTFWVAKKRGLPIGETMQFALDNANHAFLEKHYRVHPKSRWYYRLMRQNNPRKTWNRPDYASKGLQSVNTRGDQAKALLHDKNDNNWGWATNYVDVLVGVLPKGKKIPIFQFAVWIYRNEAWPEGTTRSVVVERIKKEYHLTDGEARLFDYRAKSEVDDDSMFQDVPVPWYQILEESPETPEDVPPENSGILQHLVLHGVGPVERLEFEPGPRLNIVTGDNGLGKTFLLDMAWWALTRSWIGGPPVPTVCHGQTAPEVRAVIGPRMGERNVPNKPVRRAKWSKYFHTWNEDKNCRAWAALVVYARVDGSFSVWDPLRARKSLLVAPELTLTSPVHLSRTQVWDGASEFRCEGVVRDLSRWADRPDKYKSFETFKRIIEMMSPPDLGKLTLADSSSFSGATLQDIPQIKHKYGDVPITHESAGVKRILGLAYLIVWAWESHQKLARFLDEPEERQLVILLDEAEAHLHPKWQRVILKALLGAAAQLANELEVQYLVATHSPLVLASAEDVFDENRDALFHLEISVGGSVSFERQQFVKRGSSDAWLSSPAFGVKYPGGAGRAEAIQAAEALLLEKDVTPKAVEEATDNLRDHLPSHDPFWRRWIFFAAKHQVHI